MNAVEETAKGCGKLPDMIAFTSVNNELWPTRLADIGFFRYDSKKKLWAAVLDNSASLFLHKGTNAQDILQLSSMFQQIHQSYIINLAYVKVVNRMHIRLSDPFSLYAIPVGRTFFPSLYERFHLV